MKRVKNFDWLTEEEQGWEQAARQAGADGGRLHRSTLRRYRRFIGALMFLVIAGSLLTMRGLAIRLSAAQEAARDELLAAHGLLLQAAGAGDVELFSSMLGGPDAWRQTQLQTLENNLLLERRPMGAAWLQEIAPEHEIALAPDLQQAVVTSTLRYEGYLGAGLARDVALRHLFSYQRQAGQWQLGPHSEEIWGHWVTAASGRLQTVFPGRDAELSQRLTDDLATGIERLCQHVLECSPRLRLWIRFETYPQTLHTPSMFQTGLQHFDIRLSLPAPSLVGYPVDEEAYRALRNLYLRSVVQQLFHPLSGPFGPSGQLFDAAFRGVLAELDLIAWPPAIAQEGSELAIATDILALCSEQPGPGSALLRYDAAQERWVTELAGRHLQQMMALDGASGVLLDEGLLSPLAAGGPQPSLLWWAEGRLLATLDGYYAGAPVTGGPAFSAFGADGQGAWIHVGGATDCDGRDCRGLIVRSEPTAWAPDGRHALFQRPLEGSRSPPATDGVLWLGDAGGEVIARLEDGYHPFWVDNATFGYLRASEQGGVQLSMEHELVLRRIDAPEAGAERRIVLGLEQALQERPQGENAQEAGIFVNRAFAHPSRPDVVYLSATRFSNMLSSVAMVNMTAILFAVDVSSGEVIVRLADDNAPPIVASLLSPDGRWLAYVAQQSEPDQITLAVHDLTARPDEATVFEQPLTISGISQFGPPGAWWHDWSQESGQWLFMHDGLLTVVEPQSWRTRHLVPPTAACAQAAWAD